MVWIMLNWVMSGIALTGTIINAERNKFGFAFWLISNLYFAFRFFAIEEYAQSALFAVYFLLAIKGIAVWTKKEIAERKKTKESKKYIGGCNIDGYEWWK